MPRRYTTGGFRTKKGCCSHPQRPGCGPCTYPVADQRMRYLERYNCACQSPACYISGGAAKWILDTTAVEMNIYFEFKDKIKISVKGLIGWDAANPQIIGGSMNSRGWIAVDKTTYDQQSKTWTSDLKGVDAEGNQVSWTTVLSLTDENTLTQQGKDRKGGFVQGEEGSKYTYKRVKRAQKAKSDG